MDTVTIPKSTWKKIESFLDEIKSKQTVWLNEDEACRLMKYTKGTISTHVSTGKIPASFYTVGFGGKRFYDKEKLMGLKS